MKKEIIYNTSTINSPLLRGLGGLLLKYRFKILDIRQKIYEKRLKTKDL